MDDWSSILETIARDGEEEVVVDLEEEKRERRKASRMRTEIAFIQMTYRHPSLFILTALVAAILIWLCTGFPYVASLNAAHQERMQQSSEYRLSQQKIDDGDIVYRIVPGKLMIYKKYIDRHRVVWKYGPHWVPYVDYRLLEAVEIPKIEGKYDPEIWALEKD